jgi:hypothetical protein
VTAETVNRLAAWLPPVKDNRLAAHLALDNSPWLTDDMARFLSAYKDLEFGWNFCHTLAANEMDFPFMLPRGDHWIHKAWLCMRNPETYSCPEITAARCLAHDLHGMNNRRAIVRAMLISPDYDDARMREVCSDGMLTPGAIDAYEKLFFNVRDRRNDVLYISQHVYPKTRLVEVFDGYMREDGIEKLLLRMGYNRGLVDVAYWAGLTNQLAEDLTAPGNDMAAKLEGQILAFGYLMARGGFIHQRRDVHALNSARGLIAAAKQAGIQTEDNQMFSSTVAEHLGSELRRSKIEESMVAFERADRPRDTVMLEAETVG